MNTSSPLRTVKASCQCGNAAFEIALPQDEFPFQSHLCHCTSCRQATGQLCLTTTSMPEIWQPEQELLSKLTAFVFSKSVTAYFCPTCGTTIMYGCTDSAQCLAGSGPLSWIVSMRVFEDGDSSIHSITSHIFLSDTLDGGFADFVLDLDGMPIKRFAKYTGGEELKTARQM